MGNEEAAGPARRRVIRRPAAAGTFYPADAGVLRRTIDELLEGDTARPGSTSSPKALIVPHAGYVYSGPVAACAYASMRGERVRRVLLLGPAHFVALEGAATPAAAAWATPLGDVPIDPELVAVAAEAGASVSDRPHGPEHALEVQLPFLLRTLQPGFTILPVAVGVTRTDDVASLLERLWDRADLVVVSTDLSHYLDDETAKRIDRATADAVLARDAAAIAEGSACGAFALRGLVELARRRDLTIRLLDLRTSADTAGDQRRVVGYGAFAVA